MNATITVWAALAMGLRHALDADHLAVVESVTRQRALARPIRATWTGLWFSAGHVAVIAIIAAAFALMSGQRNPPAWLAGSGALISATSLFALALLNARAAFAGDGGAVTGIRSRWLRQATWRCSNWRVIGLGALFAVSFDAVALAGLFAGSTGGALHVMGIVAMFAGGMVVLSAAHGYWLVRMLAGVGPSRTVGGRWMSSSIAIVSLTVGVWVLSKVVYVTGTSVVSDSGMTAFVILTMFVGYLGASIAALRARRAARNESMTPHETVLG